MPFFRSWPRCVCSFIGLSGVLFWFLPLWLTLSVALDLVSDAQLKAVLNKLKIRSCLGVVSCCAAQTLKTVGAKKRTERLGVPCGPTLVRVPFFHTFPETESATMIKKFTSLFPSDFKSVFVWHLTGEILSFQFYSKAVFFEYKFRISRSAIVHVQNWPIGLQRVGSNVRWRQTH